VGFTKQQLESYRGATVPDLIGPELKLLFVGINPGLWTAATQTHFAHPSNRFYPALRRAGLIEREIDPAAGMTDDDRAHVMGRGIGITNLVNRATARADELDPQELRDGSRSLTNTVERHTPEVVAVAGVSAYRVAFRRPRAQAGLQDERIGMAELWAVPNPSGLNAHETIESLALWYRRVGEAATLVRG
jgi:double-stranded uracil-DNA glycosylase